MSVCRYCGNGCGGGYDVCGAYACNVADNAPETITTDCCGLTVLEDSDAWGPDSIDDQLATCVYGHGCNVDGGFIYPTAGRYAEYLQLESEHDEITREASQ